MPPNHLDNSHCYAVEEEGGEEEGVMVVAYIDLTSCDHHHVIWYTATIMTKKKSHSLHTLCGSNHCRHQITVA